MTAKQKHFVEVLKREILACNSLGSPDEYEYKKWEVSGPGPVVLSDGSSFESPLVFISCEVGRKGDEGTLASTFCRNRRHILITPRGGIELLNSAYFVKKAGGKLERVSRQGRKPRGLWNAIHGLTN